jgi:type IV fimbrial biogenesis protein FimT
MGIATDRPVRPVARDALRRLHRLECSVREKRCGLGRSRGVTLLELLVALSIAAILVALAAPSFGSFRRAAGVGTTTSELLSALHFARSTAALEGLPVTLCLSRDEGSCVDSASAAGTGWLVFAQPDASVASSATVSSPILRSFQLPGDISVHGSRAAVTFWPATRASTTSTFDVCDVSGRTRGRAVVVSQTGRPRVVPEEASCAA